MPVTKEFEGKTVRHAVELAKKATNSSEDKLRYDVISYGSTGIFGLVGSKKAKIRVYLPHGTVLPDDETKPSAPGSCPPTASAEDILAENREEVQSLIQETFGEAPASEEPPPKSPPPRAEPEPEPDKNSENEKDQPPDLPPEEQEALLETGRQALNRIIDAITSDAEIDSRVEANQLYFHIHGGNTGALIGKRGQTLEAIQYLLEKIINKQIDGRLRVHLDVEKYLQNRKDHLIKLANRLANKSKRAGKPVTMGQMSAHDRRVVHLALKANSDVRTQSIGDGFYRKLVIYPKRTIHRRRK